MSTKFGLLIDFDLLKAAISANAKPDTIPTLQDHGYGLYMTRCACLLSQLSLGTHPTYPQRDGSGCVDLVRGYAPRWFTRLKTVTHPGTNRS